MTVLETLLTVFVIGLVTHVGDEANGERRKTHAVVVKDNAHGNTPYLRIPIGQVHNEPKQGTRGTHFYRLYLKQGDEIEFTSGVVTTGWAEAQDDFHQDTLSLKVPLTNGTVHGDAKEKKPQKKHGNEFARLFYPSGKLGIAQYHKSKAKFPDAQNIADRCVPGAIWFSPTTRNEPVTLTIRRGGGPINIVLDENATVGLVNQPEGSGHDGEKHFANYKGILVKPANEELKLAKVTRSSTCCPQSSECTTGGTRRRLSTARLTTVPGFLRRTVYDHPGCTNTDYP